MSKERQQAANEREDIAVGKLVICGSEGNFVIGPIALSFIIRLHNLIFAFDEKAHWRHIRDSEPDAVASRALCDKGAPHDMIDITPTSSFPSFGLGRVNK